MSFGLLWFPQFAGFPEESCSKSVIQRRSNWYLCAPFLFRDAQDMYTVGILNLESVYLITIGFTSSWSLLIPISFLDTCNLKCHFIRFTVIRMKENRLNKT